VSKRIEECRHQREMNHIAKSPQPRGRTTPSLSWETTTSMEMAVKSMDMAVESMEMMEMAPGAIPCPGRVLEQRFLSPEISLRRRWRCGTLSGKMLIDSRRRIYIGGGVMSEGTRGPTPCGGAAKGRGCHPIVWPPPGPPSDSSLDSVSCQGNRNFRLCFVQFREYFLCNFSETQK
jgi:hypothetical protein